MCSNPNLDLVNINAQAKLGQIPSTRSQDNEWKRNSRNNPNLDLVNINAYPKFGQILLHNILTVIFCELCLPSRFICPVNFTEPANQLNITQTIYCSTRPVSYFF